MRRSFAIATVSASLALAALTVEARQPASAPLFDFRITFWNSLHHELHALARPRPAAEPPWTATMSEIDRAGWTRALDAYRPLARRSLLFDEGLAMTSAALSGMRDGAAPDATRIDRAVVDALTAAAPGYRAAGWPEHQRASRAFVDEMSPLLARHGATIAHALAASYETTWPSRPVPVDLVRDVGPPGNAHTTARPDAHVTFTPTDPRHQGHAALELLFHEASHGWDARLSDALTRAARAEGRVIRSDLWHAVLFFTAGELTRRSLADAGATYVPYAVTQGLSTGPYGTVWPAVVDAWTPWLDRRTTLPAAATALVRAVGVLPPGPGR